MPIATVSRVIEYLLGVGLKASQPPTWPPDLFAVCAYLLQKSGCYTLSVSGWPPVVKHSTSESLKTWITSVRNHGHEWRRGWHPKIKPKNLPSRVRELWSKLASRERSKLPFIHLRFEEGREVTEILIELLAIADEASWGFGLPIGQKYADQNGIQGIDQAYIEAQRYLLPPEGLKDTLPKDFMGASLTSDAVYKGELRVLPKLHTPQTGLTIRNYSHNLSLITTNEILPIWARTSSTDWPELNLLVVPWPFEVDPHDIVEVEASSAAAMAEGFSLFEVRSKHFANIEKWLKRLCAATREELKKTPGSFARIDGIVFPEAALSADEYDAVLKVAREEHVMFLLAGVAVPSSQDKHKPAENFVRMTITSGKAGFPQHKHHRWQIEEHQIEAYGLQLSKSRKWWEYIDIKNRTLSFISVNDWLTVVPLICEDLARPDPCGDLIRAVGPSLVIAILMDGDQHEWRWSSRYATALADDPGSSVLAVTSLGMAKLMSRSRARSGQVKAFSAVNPIMLSASDASGGPCQSSEVNSETLELGEESYQVDASTETHRSVVAIWKQPGRRAVPIGISPEAKGFVVVLRNGSRDVGQPCEYSADGRDDMFRTSRVRLDEDKIVEIFLADGE